MPYKETALETMALRASGPLAVTIGLLPVTCTVVILISSAGKFAVVVADEMLWLAFFTGVAYGVDFGVVVAVVVVVMVLVPST